MRLDIAVLLRLGAALLLFSLIVLGLFLIGAAQSFYEETLALLFLFLRALSWGGLLVCLGVLLPLARRQARQWGAALLMSVGFATLFVFVLAWGAWVYPSGGGLPW